MFLDILMVQHHCLLAPNSAMDKSIAILRPGPLFVNFS